jgi:NAD(P)-dependent dehydrogenase (short-subunit alcohol dehydrogenase family)
VGGAHAIVHGRNRERGEALVREIEIAGNGSAPFYAADLASLAEVRSFAAATAPAISILCYPLRLRPSRSSISQASGSARGPPARRRAEREVDSSPFGLLIPET